MRRNTVEFDIGLTLSWCRGTSGSFGLPSEKDDKRSDVDIEFLDVFALERWEVRPVHFHNFSQP